MQSHRARTSPVLAAFADNRAIISPSVYRVFTESVPRAVASGPLKQADHWSAARYRPRY